MNVPALEGRRKRQPEAVEGSGGSVPGVEVKETGIGDSTKDTNHTETVTPGPEEGKMLKVVKTRRTRELWVNDKRVFLTTIGVEFGEVPVEIADWELEEAIKLWS